MRRTAALLSAFCATFLISLCGCAVGPRYSRPAAQVPPAFKEVPSDWKVAQPQDQISRGKWWQVFHDAQLNELEERVDVSNQNLKAAFDQFLQARALVRYDRADYYPTVTAGASASRNRQSANRGLATAFSITNYSDITVPLSVTWEPDFFGKIRNTVRAARSNAQASAADLENLRLVMHADLAADYFQLRTLDSEEKILTDNVGAFQQALQLTDNRHKGGIASGVDVAQAQTQLESTRAQAIDVQVARAQFEHAIATLVGKPASTFSIAVASWNAPPPPIPPGMPSDLLERRPDIAVAERRVSSADAELGIARAAYFPAVTLSGSGGFESSTISNLISGPSGFLSAGASALVIAFDVGRRRAINQQAEAAYDQAVAQYRQTLLTAFQEVEDNLAALRILSDEAKTQDAAVAAAERSLTLSTNRYKGGVVDYLEVLTAQSTALTNQRLAIGILRRRLTGSVSLIQALGGGWNAKALPIVQNQTHSPASPGQ